MGLKKVPREAIAIVNQTLCTYYTMLIAFSQYPKAINNVLCMTLFII